jgi:hypothetical protein
VKRSIGILFLAAVLGAALAVPGAVAKDAKGPNCTDFIGGDPGYFYNPSNDSGTVTVDMKLASPFCADVTYLLDIKDLETGNLLVNDLAPDTRVGNVVSFSYTFGPGNAPGEATGDPNNPFRGGVCLVAESYWRDHLSDRAPDTGCEEVPIGSSGGGGGMF